MDGWRTLDRTGKKPVSKKNVKDLITVDDFMRLEIYNSRKEKDEWTDGWTNRELKGRERRGWMSPTTDPGW